MSDQDRISPYNINTISRRQVMRKTNISIKGLLVDPISNSLNQLYKNCMADNEEITNEILGVNGLIDPPQIGDWKQRPMIKTALRGQ